MDLYWEPAERKKHSLSDALKFVLRKRYDGTVHETLSSHDIPYLEGLRDSGVADAQDLIDAIQKYENVIVTEE